MKNIFLVMILMFCGAYGWSQNLTTDGTRIIDQDGEPVILRGMGLGGWMLMEGYMMQSADVAPTQHEMKEKLTALMGEEKMEAFFDVWLENHVTKKDIDSLAAWGFNSVRLPMHYNLFTLPIEDEPVYGQNTWLDKGFVMVDNLLEWCQDNNMYLILDLHAAPGGQGEDAPISDYDDSKPSLWESELNRDKTVALWAKLADRYKNEPWIGGYDLINEVNWDLNGNTMLRNLYEDITDAIREVDTEHIIFIEGNWFANDFTGLTPPWDENMVYSFHKYWNYNDQSSIEWAINLSEQYDIPLWMGEGGENSNVWFRDAIALLEANDIGWSFWPMKRIETVVGHYSIPFTDGYQNILAYWRGEVEQPSVDEAYEAMMELATNSNSANCSYHKDVWDAQIRQVSTDETIAYRSHEIPGVVYMSDYDLGRLNYAYSDTDYANYAQSTGEYQAGNSGYQYRNDGVDIQSNEDTIYGNGYHVAFIKKDEWMNYTVHIAEPGVYQANMRVASATSGGLFHLALNGEDITPTQTVSSTGGWTDFADLQVEDILLPEGEQVITMWFDSNTAFNVSSMEFVRHGAIVDADVEVVNGSTGADEKSLLIMTNQALDAATVVDAPDDFIVTVNGQERAVLSVSFGEQTERTILLELEEYVVYTDDILVSYHGTTIQSLSGKVVLPFSDLPVRNTLATRSILPLKIEAEDYTEMFGIGMEETSDTGGGYNIGYMDSGDFADYLIYSASESQYKVSVRVAAQNAAGSFGFYLLDDEGSETELCVIETPLTGGWQTWETVEETVTIPKGAYTLRMRAIAEEFNLNWYDFDVLTDIDENIASAKSDLSVFPNPVSGDVLVIDFGAERPENVFVELYTFSGILISADQYIVEDGRLTIDMAHLDKGSYLVKTAFGEVSKVIKVIRQ